MSNNEKAAGAESFHFHDFRLGCFCRGVDVNQLIISGRRRAANDLISARYCFLISPGPRFQPPSQRRKSLSRPNAAAALAEQERGVTVIDHS